MEQRETLKVPTADLAKKVKKEEKKIAANEGIQRKGKNVVFVVVPSGTLQQMKKTPSERHMRPTPLASNVPYNSAPNTDQRKFLKKKHAFKKLFHLKFTSTSGCIFQKVFRMSLEICFKCQYLPFKFR